MRSASACPLLATFIRVKSMLIAPSDDYSAHAVSVNPPTAENPKGYLSLLAES